MSISLRKKARISYYEPEEPAFDEYLFCDSCADYTFEYCAIHGPLLVIPDNEVQSSVSRSRLIPTAALTIPNEFLHIAPSSIPGAGLGVFSTLTLPSGVRFGPYRGKSAMDARTDYCWQIFNGNNKPSHVVDASDANKSNWMRYVNCSRRWQEQNLLAYQYQGQLYYRTIKIVPKFTELLVFYGSEFALLLGIDLKHYNSSQPQRKSIVLKPTNQQPTKPTSIEDIEAPSRTSERNQRQKFICDKCQRCFYSRPPIIRHLRTNHCINQLQCSICSFKTTRKTTLTKHLDLHDLNRKFQCPECNLRFNKPSNLKSHMKPRFNNGIQYACFGLYKNKLSQGQRIFCPSCPYETPRSWDMRRHAKTHSRVTCDMCQMTFSLESELLRHRQSVTCKESDKPFKCDYCSYRSTVRKYLMRHVKRTHNYLM